MAISSSEEPQQRQTVMTKKTTCRIDECAHRVLVAARWPIRISSTNDDDGVKNNIRVVITTPYLDELERSVDLLLRHSHCPPLRQAQSRGDDSGNCRAADGSTQSSWSPQIMDDADDDDGPSLLVELAPFTSEFYVALAALVNEAYRPLTTTTTTTYETVNSSSAAVTTTTTSNDRQQILHEALYSVEMYSLPYMNDATRITNILLALQNSYIDTATTSSFSMGNDDNNNDGGGGGENNSSSSFLSLLLSQSTITTSTSTSTSSNGSQQFTNNNNNSILSSLFHHWSQLSRMEGELRNLIKRYTALLPVDSESYAHYCNHRQGCEMIRSGGSSSDGAGGDSDANAIPKTTTLSSSSSSSTISATSSFLSERALSIETLRSRFENELVTHISSLRDLLSYLYLHANASMRGKCRRWMGGWLRNFAYGGSGANVSLGMTVGGIDDTDHVLGSSFVHFCPLLFATPTTTTITNKGTGKKVGVVGIGSNALGVENTSACGVESLLQVLLRIILGFRRRLHINDDDKQKFQLRTSHKHLLFDVILPLHRPSGMVLWRDQTPIIGLYHETLTKIMGAFITKLDRSLVGPIIGALLHPDIWPVGEGGNTPKVVLLLHEVDTLLGLLKSGPTTSDNGGDNNNNNNKHLDTEYYLSSFDTYLIPLITRLCFCISCENSRTSERALQFFRNSTFVNLIKRRLGDVGSILLRALCRCPSMDIPWNPTVRKMTLLVLQELEGYYIEVEDAQMTFEKACDDALLGVNLSSHDNNHGSSVTVVNSSKVSGTAHARHIDKTKSRSSWPEYAVKVVSTQKIEEMGYEQSINMEIAILGTLSHPGISRLVSSFRFRDGAYLVLEYASGGDLHTLLRHNGSLDHDSTRFVIGSVAAALSSIHERGFVYVDCKPENVLITETGHIKITDFGGCRPVTQEAKDMAKESSKNLLKQLRDGDWRPNNHDNLSSSYSADRVTTENDHEEEDIRIEGTTAYLPPEVVIGGYPTTAVDVWALGCVLFQCISGQPPILEDTDDLTVQKIVIFNISTDDDDFFGKGGSAFRDDAKVLIRSMLSRDAPDRPDVNQIAEFKFFEGMDIFTLHKNPAHPLDVGSVAAPASDAKWARRQFSSIWAPQPRNYNIAGLVTKATAGNFGTEVITEGDEADEEFLVGQNIPKLFLTKIRE